MSIGSASEERKLAILGDLHLEPDQMRLFHKARSQVNSILSDELGGHALPGSGVVQLGDVGGYNSQPGQKRNNTLAPIESHFPAQPRRCSICGVGLC